MKHSTSSVITIFILITYSASAFSKAMLDNERINAYYDMLSYDRVDFNPTGAVCERVAVRELEPVFPPENYKIINSISYTQHDTTIGELDVVVFNKSTGMVEAVAEVKCWTSFKDALKKAKDQRIRFLTHLNNKIEITDKNHKKYSKEDFKNIQKYFTISQEGGVNQGFDFELSLNYNELMEVRKKLLECRAEGRCPRR